MSKENPKTKQITFTQLLVTDGTDATGKTRRYAYPLGKVKEIQTHTDKLIRSEGNEAVEMTLTVRGRLLLLALRSGKAMPRTEMVHNTITLAKEANKRKVNHIELNSEVFFVSDLDTGVAFISNLTKKGVIEDVLRRYVRDTLALQTITIGYDEFVEKIKYVRSIELMGVPGLFNDNCRNICDAVAINLPGIRLDNVGKFILRFEMTEAAQSHQMLSSIVDFFKRNEEQRRAPVKQMTCVATDSKNFETTLNMDTFARKITVNACVDEGEMFMLDSIADYFAQHRDFFEYENGT